MTTGTGNSRIGLVKASPDVIRRRMTENPHPHQVVPEKDIEMVSARFERRVVQEFERSAIANKLTVDTSTDTPAPSSRAWPACWSSTTPS